MTTKDLRIEYQKEGNENPFDVNFKLRVDAPIAEYILYLEKEVLSLRNDAISHIDNTVEI